MKKAFKLLLIVMSAFFISSNVVEGADTINVDVYMTTVNSSSVFGIGSHSVMIKKVGSDYVYCAEEPNTNLYANSNPQTFEYTYSSTANDKIGYICKNREKSSNDDYYVTNLALWYYLHSGNLPDIVKNVYNSTSTNANVVAAKKLINDAKNGQTLPSVSISTSGASQKTVTIDEEYYYVYGPITISHNTDKATLSFTSNSIDAKMVSSEKASSTINSITNSGGQFYIRVKASKINTTASVGIKAEVSGTKGVGKIYTDTKNQMYGDPIPTYGNRLQSILVCSTTSASDSETTSISFSKPKYDVKISKIDKDGNKIGGAVFTIKNSDTGDTILNSLSSTSTERISVQLSPGNYTLEETKSPDGYKKISNKINFTVGEDGKVKNYTDNTIEIQNEPIIVKISKTDIAGSKEIPDAQLRILDEDNKIVKDVEGNELKWTSTVEKKEIHMKAGTYYLEETIAPDGYVKNTEKIKFVVDSNGKVKVNGKEVTSVVMTNEPVKVTISKRGLIGSDELEGAKLKITDKDTGKVVKDLDGKDLEWTSGKEPVSFHLGQGTYVLTETIAPEGYELSDKSIVFTIDADGKILDEKEKEIKDGLIVFRNTPEAVPVPTGSKFIYIAILGIVAIGTSVYFLLKKKD